MPAARAWSRVSRPAGPAAASKRTRRRAFGLCLQRLRLLGRLRGGLQSCSGAGGWRHPGSAVWGLEGCRGQRGGRRGGIRSRRGRRQCPASLGHGLRRHVGQWQAGEPAAEVGALLAAGGVVQVAHVAASVVAHHRGSGATGQPRQVDLGLVKRCGQVVIAAHGQHAQLGVEQPRGGQVGQRVGQGAPAMAEVPGLDRAAQQHVGRGVLEAPAPAAGTRSGRW
jgi:hypothetical protein